MISHKDSPPEAVAVPADGSQEPSWGPNQSEQSPGERSRRIVAQSDTLFCRIYIASGSFRKGGSLRQRTATGRSATVADRPTWSSQDSVDTLPARCKGGLKFFW